MKIREQPRFDIYHVVLLEGGDWVHVFTAVFTEHLLTKSMGPAFPAYPSGPLRVGAELSLSASLLPKFLILFFPFT